MQRVKQEELNLLETRSLMLFEQNRRAMSCSFDIRWFDLSGSLISLVIPNFLHQAEQLDACPPSYIYPFQDLTSKPVWCQIGKMLKQVQHDKVLCASQLTSRHLTLPLSSKRGNSLITQSLSHSATTHAVSTSPDIAVFAELKHNISLSSKERGGVRCLACLFTPEVQSW